MGTPAEQLAAGMAKAIRRMGGTHEHSVAYVDRQQIVGVCEHARDAEGLEFDVLMDLTAVDRLPEQPRFEVVYQLYSMKHGHRLWLKVQLAGDEHVPSVSSLWPSAAPAEREVYDLFGITFSDHPDLRRIMMPDDWDGHPLRRDYPLEGHTD